MAGGQVAALCSVSKSVATMGWYKVKEEGAMDGSHSQRADQARKVEGAFDMGAYSKVYKQHAKCQSLSLALWF